MRRPAETVERFDRVCVRSIAARRTRRLNQVFVLGSHSGQVGIPWAVLLLAVRATAADGRRVSAPRAIATTVGTWAVAHLAKRADHRRRPCQRGDVASLIPCPKSSSFPSDEAASAFSGAVYLAARIPRLRTRLYLAALFTAFSRVYVGAHYPSDVTAGALLGATIGRLASYR